MKRLPPEAFEFYVSLGGTRSYDRVARQYGVSKRSVVTRAARDGWQRRLTVIEARAQEGATQRTVDTLEEVKVRHLKAFKAVQLKALECLRSTSFADAMDAVKALEIAARQELLALGEPSQRTAITVEDAIRREYERWLVPDADGEGEREALDAGEAAVEVQPAGDDEIGGGEEADSEFDPDGEGKSDGRAE